MTVAALISLMLASCQLVPGSGSDVIQQARALVRAQLLHPSSARFREVRVVPQQTGAEPAVCGLVNGRNAAGVYAGFQRFHVRDGEVGLEPRPGGASVDHPGGGASWRSNHLRFCTLGGGVMSPPPRASNPASPAL
jgi:hypothetical protein